jgi:MFS transporter, Spinster family, sphingosine-1-phosphate transporter
MAPRQRAYAWYIVGLLSAINFFNYVDRLVIVTMYDGLRARFHFSDDQLGAFWFAFFTVHAVATFPLGWASDHFDRRKIIGFGVIIWSLATLGSAYAWGFLSMLILRGAIGIGEAAYGPPANALLCEVFPERKARVVGIFNAGMFAGATIGLMLGGFLGFPRAFQVVALPGLILGVLVVFLDVPPERVAPESRPSAMSMLKDGWRALRVPSLRWMLPAGVLISFAAGGYISWIVDFTLRYKGLSQHQASVIYAVIVFTAGIPGAVLSGILADRLMRRTPAGRTLTVAIGFTCSVPFAILVLLLDRGWPFYAAGWGLLFFLPWYSGPMAAVIDDVVDDDDAGTAQATFVFFSHAFGTGPAGFLLGLMSRYSSLKAAFILPAVAILLAAGCAYMAARHVGRDMRAKAERVLLLRA